MAYKMTPARRAALRKAQMASARARKLKRKASNSRVVKKARSNKKAVAMAAAGLIAGAIVVKAGTAVYKNNKKYEQKVYRESSAMIRAKKSPFTHRGGKTQKRKAINPVIRNVARSRRPAAPKKPMGVWDYTRRTVFGRRD